MKTESIFLPEVRKEGLITKEVDGELLIYDRRHDQAHCLNATAAAIMKHCDGHTTARDIATKLTDTMKDGAASGCIDEQVVWLGLEELRRKNLLMEPLVTPPPLLAMSGMSRREAVRRIGIGAAIALPIVSTIISPTPAQAATCKRPGQPCNASADCCSGLCVPPAPGGTCVGSGPNPQGRTVRRR